MKNASKYIAIVTLFLITIISCDKDFTSLDSDIINSENAIDFTSERLVLKDEIIAYNKALSPVETNNLPISLLGVYNDNIYGSVTSSVLTQVSLSTLDPDFGENVELDSVVLTLPYFSVLTGSETDGTPTYEIDSIFGEEPINIKIYESNYFLRDFNPNSSFDETQKYFSNQSLSETEQIPTNLLEGEEILIDPQSFNNLNNFIPSPEAIELKDIEGNITGYTAPGIRIKLSKEFWQEKILDMQDQPELSNANNFSNFFKGLYFRAESASPNQSIGNLMMLDFGATNANITLFYTKDPFTEGADRDEVSYVINFDGVRANFFNNNFTLNLEDGDAVNGDQQLFLKGGQGSITSLRLFEGLNIDDIEGDNAFEEFKKTFVITNENGEFFERKRLINEANLVFTVDETFGVSPDEITRLYLFDATNNRILIDYATDVENAVTPFNSRIEHLGQHQVLENENGQEVRRYKFNITQHLINVLTRDSTNVELGLGVSANINIEGQLPQKGVIGDNNRFVPSSSVISPRGTVLIGNTNPDENKRVYLEIFYTEPETSNTED